jgi:hypothetical protein
LSDLFCFQHAADGSCYASAKEDLPAIHPQKSLCEEAYMKRYVKPGLKQLGPLRVVTRFSGCPAGEASIDGGCYPAFCWIAAVVFDENILTGPRVKLVRAWLVNEFEPSGTGAKFVMGLYRKYGERVAKVVEKNAILKRSFRKLFDKALAKAEAQYNTL